MWSRCTTKGEHCNRHLKCFKMLRFRPRSRFRDLPERSLKKNLGVLLGEGFFLQSALRTVPLVNPINHPEQGECRRPRSDDPLCSTSTLNLRHQVLQEMNVVFLAGVDALAQ